MRPFEVDWWPNGIICGAGTVGNLAQALSDLGKERALLICGPSIGASKVATKVKEILTGRLVGVFSEVEMHAPIPVLEKVAGVARTLEADVVVSLGGGSAIDSAKGACLLERVGLDYGQYALEPGRPRGAQSMPPLRLAHIAIPTTTGSGSEVTPTCGLLDPALGHKRIFRSERLIPDLAILDPEMATETPVRLTACSGMTAVARCVESLYGGRRNPFRSALALYALGFLKRSLPKSIMAPSDLEARMECLVGAAMSAVAANVNTSAVHAIGHIVGGRYGLQHGIAHAILLPSAMRVMLPQIADEQKSVLFALGGSLDSLTADQSGARAADIVAALVAELPMPKQLREVGVEESALEDIAEHASNDPILLGSGANLTSDVILSLLISAY
jgi:alcohol dehydrogenase class IV